MKKVKDIHKLQYVMLEDDSRIYHCYPDVTSKGYELSYCVTTEDFDVFSDRQDEGAYRVCKYVEGNTLVKVVSYNKELFKNIENILEIKGN